MGLKTFGIRGKIGSIKHKLFHLFRLVSTVRNERSDIYSSNRAPTDTPYVPVNLLSEVALDIELTKAQAVDYWRRWLDNRGK